MGPKKSAKKATTKAKDATKKATAKAKDAGKKAKDAGKKASEKAKKAAAKAKNKLKKFKADPELFRKLSEGERADALRTLTEDKRLSAMSKVGRYRIIATEPLAVKPPNPRVGNRLARVVAYDYAADRSVEATVDLDEGCVADLSITQAQPMLSIEEEDIAISIALADASVKDKLALGDEPLAAMHYWSRREVDYAFTRRSAAVMFGQGAGRATWVVVVDLLDSQVTEIVPATSW